MDLDNQYSEYVYLIFILKSFRFCIQIVKSKKKQAFNQTVINGEQHKEARETEKRKFVTEKKEDMRVYVEL